MTTEVDVNIVRLDWLNSKQSDERSDFAKVIGTLKEPNAEALYTTQFVRAMLDTIYPLKDEVIKKVLFPFLLQSIAIILYLSIYMNSEK